jgi:hypothetical protein
MINEGILSNSGADTDQTLEMNLAPLFNQTGGGVASEN